MFIELHIIQNFPPSNLNRDDVGQPKSAVFGDVPRARISSQCLKRTIRYAGKDPHDRASNSIFEQYTNVQLSDRTRLIISELIKRLVAMRPNQETNANLIAKAFAEAYAGGLDSKEEKTNVLLYLSRQELSQIAQKLDEDWDALISALSSETLIAQIADHFAQIVTHRDNELAKDQVIRARDLSRVIQTRLERNGRQSNEARSIANDFKKVFKSDVKVFSLEELDSVSNEIDRNWDAIQTEKKVESPLKPIVEQLIKETKGRTSAPDIAFFGRMLADKPETNIDAACQVAHAISTHAVNYNIDYFTAVDTLQPKEETGAAFLDVAYFNSACFYRYARIDSSQLVKNLGGEIELAQRSVEAFLRASEAAIPSGKKNSHAQECRPDFMLAVLRESGSSGWSLVNAFEKPVIAEREGGLIEGSVQRLDKLFNHLIEFYSDESIKAISVALPSGVITPESLSPILRSVVKTKLNEWVNAICEPLKQGV